MPATLAAPASGARVQYHQARRRVEGVAPAGEAQQVGHEPVVRLAIEPAVMGGRIEPFAAGGQRLGQAVGIVAPSLTQQVRDQRITHDPARERMFVDCGLPGGGEVPVIGDVMVIEDHQRGKVGEQARHVWQPGDESIDVALFDAVAILLLGGESRNFHLDQPPRCRRPHQQIHRQQLGEGDQVVFRAGGGEDRLAHTAEELLAQSFGGADRRQQLVAVIVGLVASVELAAAGDLRPLQALVIESESGNQRMNGGEHRAGHVVGIDLIAGHQ